MSIRRKVGMGAFWLILTRMGDRAAGFVSTLILARLLVPADFGVLALAMSVVALVDVIRQFGFEMVLISNQEADRGDFDIARQPDAEDFLFACIAPALLLGSQVGVSRSIEHQVECSWIVAAVIGGAGRSHVGLVECGEQVLASNRFGRQPNLCGKEVDSAFDRGGGLGAAGSPESSDRRRVRRHHLAIR